MVLTEAFGSEVCSSASFAIDQIYFGFGINISWCEQSFVSPPVLPKKRSERLKAAADAGSSAG